MLAQQEIWIIRLNWAEVELLNDTEDTNMAQLDDLAAMNGRSRKTAGFIGK